MPTERTQLGSAAEDAVARELQSRGYRILGRNWRRPWGELDIIAEHRRVVHFIEVKASRIRREGFDPFLRADGRKMHKVRRTAQTWLSAHRYGPETEWQMDIASVIWATQGPEIELFDGI